MSPTPGSSPSPPPPSSTSATANLGCSLRRNVHHPQHLLRLPLLSSPLIPRISDLQSPIPNLNLQSHCQSQSPRDGDMDGSGDDSGVHLQNPQEGFSKSRVSLTPHGLRGRLFRRWLPHPPPLPRYSVSPNALSFLNDLKETSLGHYQRFSLLIDPVNGFDPVSAQAYFAHPSFASEPCHRPSLLRPPLFRLRFVEEERQQGFPRLYSRGCPQLGQALQPSSQCLFLQPHSHHFLIHLSCFNRKKD